MRLDEYVEGLERDESLELRKLAEEKSYAITSYLDDARLKLEENITNDTVVGSTAPSVFIGRSSYPTVPTGVLAPVGNEDEAAEYVTSGNWYKQGYSIEDVFQRRTGLLNSTRHSNVDVYDVWDGFVGVQREVAIADTPVDVELGFESKPGFDLADTVDNISAPVGPRARAESAILTENPYVPRPIQKTLADDDWRADGAMTYLYRKGFDVYEINDILSVGALGRDDDRRLVPTRWSITAVDDTIGQYLRGRIRNAPSIDETLVWHTAYMGNEYWIVATPGEWEYELVELKAPGSIWNPNPDGQLYIGADSEGYSGRTSYVSETAGAYYAGRLGVLEELHRRNRQGKILILRYATNEYWAPVGVWQIRESIRAAVNGDPVVAETFHTALRTILPKLPISLTELRRKSTMAAGIQTNLQSFTHQ